MNTIGSKITSFTKRLIVWQFLCVCIPLIALFLLIGAQAVTHEERYRDAFDKTARAITSITAETLREKIALIGEDALALSAQANEIFTYSDRFSYNATFYKDGDLYKNEQKKPFTFYTPNELNQDARKKAGRLLLLLPLLEARTNAIPVSSGFVYLEDPFVLTYPPISSIDINSTSKESLYESVRKNPRKQWRLSINGGLKIAAPVFAASRPIGVAGFELSNEKLFDGALRNISAPKNGFTFIADTQNKAILYGATAGGFDETRYFSGETQNGFELIETDIDGTPLRLVYGAPIAEIDAVGAELYRNLTYISVIITASVLLFYLLFCLRSARTARLLTESIVRPLDMVARFSYRLGTRKAARIEPMGVTEFDDFANHMRLTHSKLLPPLTIDEATGLYNRRALLEDLDDKGPFGLIVIGARLHCDDDALYLAASDSVLKQIGEIMRRGSAIDDTLYRIGSNRLAALSRNDNREALRIIARKIADAINNKEFEFNSSKFKATAIFGVASGDKNIDGAKLIADAEADMIKKLTVDYADDQPAHSETI
ncbi:MAG: hypothetical protein LBF86_01750 [Helicobacteraceae bacterium]|jgi:GGDEF domain-containing protein|nr:hypothetical protein [Helicobacteraceae bacterium]